MNFPHKIRFVNYKSNNDRQDDSTIWTINQSFPIDGLVVPIAGGDADVNYIYRNIYTVTADYAYAIYTPVDKFNELRPKFLGRSTFGSRNSIDIINVEGEYNPFLQLVSFDNQKQPRLPTKFIDSVSIYPQYAAFTKTYTLSSL